MNPVRLSGYEWKVKERKKKTTKTAKSAGILAGLGTVALAFWIYLGLLFLLDEVIGFSKKAEPFIVGFFIVILIASILVSIFIGRKINNQWSGYRKRRKIVTNLLSITPIIPMVLFWILEALPSKRKRDYNYKSYTEFYEKSVGAGDVIVYLAGSEESIRGSIIGESKKFITMKARREKFLIPKDKILFIEED